jgi:putative MFS transporter
MPKQTLAEYVSITLDEMPIRRFHWRILSLIVAGLFFDLFDVAIFGSLAPDMVQSHFALPGDVALIASATFFGLLIGSVGQGELTDRLGRKAVYQANLLLYGATTLAAAFAPNVWSLAVLRFIAGLGLGAEIPLAYSYAAEFAPRATRGRTMALVNLVGGMFPFPSALLFAILLRGTLGWRGIFAAIGIAALVVFVFRISLPESPRWLATRGRGREALAVLQRLGAAPPAAELDHTPPAIVHDDPLRTVLVHYTRRVIALMLAVFCSFAALYVLVTWLPTLMGARGFDIAKSLTFTLVVTSAFPFSSLVMAVLLDRIGRIRMTVASFILAGLAALCFMAAAGETMLLISGFFMALFTVTTANILDILCAELFPTSARSSGSGLGFGAGRLGAMLASYLMLGILAGYGVQGVFVVVAAILGVGALSTALLGTETKRLSLEAISTADLTVPAAARVLTAP